MEVVVKVRFNSSSEKIESFGNNKYLMYLTFPQEEDTPSVIAELLSRRIGVPASKIHFLRISPFKDWVFQVE